MASKALDLTARRQEISDVLVAKRREAGVLREFPGELPANLKEAYAVQALSRASWPDKIIGWKVGGIPPVHREALGADYLSGPIFARRFFQSLPSGRSKMPVFAEGFAAIEPEFVLQLAESDLEDRVFIGAEIASSPIFAINDVGPLAVICDFGNNNGLLVGKEIANWRDMEGVEVAVTTEINGQLVAKKSVFDLPQAVFRARDFLLNLAKEEGFDVPPGSFVSTGAITGVHDALCGDRSKLDFGSLGSLELELIAEQPF